MRNVHVLRCLRRWFAGKRSEELERGNAKLKLSVVVLPSLAEADEADGHARRSADREVAGHGPVVQVVVVLARINDRPQARTPVVLDHEDPPLGVNKIRPNVL